MSDYTQSDKLNINFVNNKVAVGILMNTLDMGGAEKQSLLQAKLMRSEFDVYYFVQKKKPQLKQHLDFIEKEKIFYIQLSGNIFSRSIQLIGYIKKYRIRVLFAYLTLDNFLAGVISLFQNIKCIGGVRSSSLPAVKFYLTRLLQRHLLDYMIFNNYYGREIFIKNGFSPEKSIVIQNCINNIQPVLARPDKEIVKILSVGRFTAQKDYMTALKSILLLKKLIPEKKIEYILVGDGELYHQIQNWVKSLQISDVTIVRNPSNIDDYYREADIYFLSSDSEGMPNSIMEALNFSLPVVSTDAGDANYLVKDGITGFMAPVKDYRMLAEKLGQLVVDSSLRNNLGMNGHSLLIRDFSEKMLQSKFIDFTNMII
jgi:glycosyltransferase involved in cell wall biosynthesis